MRRSASAIALDYDGAEDLPGHPDLKGFGANGRMFFWLRPGVVEGRPRMSASSRHSQAQVDAAYAAAMAAGATDNGIRPARSFTTTRATTRRKVLDPDGYSLEFVYKNWQH